MHLYSMLGQQYSHLNPMNADANKWELADEATRLNSMYLGRPTALSCKDTFVNLRSMKSGRDVVQ